MRWLKAAVLLRAFVLWALLIGQAVVIGVALIRIDLIDHPYGADLGLERGRGFDGRGDLAALPRTINEAAPVAATRRGDGQHCRELPRGLPAPHDGCDGPALEQSGTAAARSIIPTTRRRLWCAAPSRNRSKRRSSANTRYGVRVKRDCRSCGSQDRTCPKNWSRTKALRRSAL